MRKFSLLLIGLAAFAEDFEFALEDNNIFYQTEESYYDYNLLRGTVDYYPKAHPNYSAKLILDNKNYIFENKKDESKNRVYRAYIQYADAKHFLVAGRQRVPFGVGKLWSPLDIFNREDPTSTTTKEKKGLDAVNYEYALSDTGNLKIVGARDKGAVKYKQTGFAVLAMENKEYRTLGYEFQKGFFDDAIDLKSEGGYFFSKEDEDDYFDYIVGFEKGFENSLNLIFEYSYNSLTETEHIGINGNYQATPLWILETTLIKNIEDESSFANFSGTYSLSNESTLRAGVLLYDGKYLSEFSLYDDALFIDFFIQF